LLVKFFSNTPPKNRVLNMVQIVDKTHEHGEGLSNGNGGHDGDPKQVPYVKPKPKRRRGKTIGPKECAWNMDQLIHVQEAFGPNGINELNATGANLGVKSYRVTCDVMKRVVGNEVFFNFSLVLPKCRDDHVPKGMAEGHTEGQPEVVRIDVVQPKVPGTESILQQQGTAGPQDGHQAPGPTVVSTLPPTSNGTAGVQAPEAGKMSKRARKMANRRARAAEAKRLLEEENKTQVSNDDQGQGQAQAPAAARMVTVVHPIYGNMMISSDKMDAFFKATGPKSEPAPRTSTPAPTMTTSAPTRTTSAPVQQIPEDLLFPNSPIKTEKTPSGLPLQQLTGQPMTHDHLPQEMTMAQRLSVLHLQQDRTRQLVAHRSQDGRIFQGSGEAGKGNAQVRHPVHKTQDSNQRPGYCQNGQRCDRAQAKINVPPHTNKTPEVITLNDDPIDNSTPNNITHNDQTKKRSPVQQKHYEDLLKKKLIDEHYKKTETKPLIIPSGGKVKSSYTAKVRKTPQAVIESRKGESPNAHLLNVRPLVKAKQGQDEPYDPVDWNRLRPEVPAGTVTTVTDKIPAGYEDDYRMEIRHAPGTVDMQTVNAAASGSTEAKPYKPNSVIDENGIVNWDVVRKDMKPEDLVPKYQNGVPAGLYDTDGMQFHLAPKNQRRPLPVVKPRPTKKTDTRMAKGTLQPEKSKTSKISPEPEKLKTRNISPEPEKPKFPPGHPQQGEFQVVNNKKKKNKKKSDNKTPEFSAEALALLDEPYEVIQSLDGTPMSPGSPGPQNGVVTFEDLMDTA
jgi:hypothetical protein